MQPQANLSRRIALGVGLFGVSAASVGLLAMRESWAEVPSVGEISYLSGDADRMPTGATDWLALKTGSKVSQGDRLRTKPKGRLEAKLKDGSLLRLGESSELKLEQAMFDKKNPQQKKVEARLFVGRVWAAVSKLFGGEESKFEVTTSNAVAGVRGTRFEAAADASGSTTVKVYGGKVLVSNKPIYAVEGATKAKRVQVAGPQEISRKQWTELVAGSMQMIQVSAAGDMSEVQPFAMNTAPAAGDDWESWNAERDKQSGVGSDQ